MSGQTLADNISDPHKQPSDAQATQLGDDPTASLRAAALRTLKSKRRKPNLDQPSGLPARPLTTQTPSVVLDYGQQDSSPNDSPVVLKSSTSVPEPRPMDVDDAHMREEGEISDSEAPPVPVPSKPPKDILPHVPRVSPKPLCFKRSPTPRRHHHAEAGSSTVLKLDPPSRSLPPGSPQRLGSFATSLTFPPDLSIYPVDENHVRPGLAMTQAQYDTAKDIVLDLLGWGVPPEHLVNCGLSREIIYYVFTELNLRFPNNFDTSFISHDPYVYHGSPEPLTPPPFVDITHRSRSLSVTSPPSIPSRPIQGHPSLPQKPSAPQGTISTPSMPPVGTSIGTSAITSMSPSSTPNLQDMEQQRRQELLARKAVLASRKLKPPGSVSLSSKPSPPDHKTESKSSESTEPIVPKETVDDFLNSIGSVHSDTSDDKLPMSREQSHNDMDVDEPPGLSGLQELAFFDLPSRSSVSSSRDMSVSDVSSPIVTTFSSQVSHRSLPRPDSPKSASIASRASTTTSITASSAVVGSQRRGMKRPVAADFVDMEPTSRHHAATGYSSSSYRHASVRQKTSSFAGLSSGIRRMVINLSDTEDEDEDDAGTGKATVDASTTHVAIRPVRPPPRFARRYEPASTLPSRVASPSVLTPALLEKEEQIKKMREEIAALEKNMHRKKAASSASSPPLPTGEPAAILPSVKVKEEEEDMTTPPISSCEPSAEEQSTAQPPILGCSHPPSPSSEPQSTSNDSSSTPIDNASNIQAQLVAGDKLPIVETQQEQVIDSSFSTSSTPEPSRPSPSVTPVDAVPSNAETSSAQFLQQDTPTEPVHLDQNTDSSTSRFFTYQSPLSWYPLLRSHSRPYSLDQPTTLSQAGGIGTASHLLTSLDLQPLKVAAASKFLLDPSRRVCQYEVPGGGECRDQDCEDIHLSRLAAVEPTDDETAQYLCSCMPSGSKTSVGDIKAALESARSHSVNSSFESRVAEALASLNLR